MNIFFLGFYGFALMWTVTFPPLFGKVQFIFLSRFSISLEGFVINNIIFLLSYFTHK